MDANNLILIGSSTGGPKVLREIFKDTSRNDSVIIIVQHMPKYINESLRNSLDSLTDMHVKIAKDEDELKSGTVYIAPSEKHIKLENNSQIILYDDEKVNHAKPSIDVLFESVQKKKNQEITAIILSGVGADGAAGISHIKEIGGKTYVQKVENKAIRGMPEAAINTGKIDKILTVDSLKLKIFKKDEIKSSSEDKDDGKKNNIVIIGSSTGGPRTLKRVFEGMPKLNAPVLLVQHMPLFMNDSLKKSIERITDMDVKIAKDKEILQNGTVYIAPSEVHMKIINNMQVKLEKSEKVNYVCPSIDVTMESIKKECSKNIFGVILTGMGKDGAKGLSYLKKIGGTTFSQDAPSCIIYGMPRAAYETGDVDYVLPPEKIKEKLIQIVGTID